MFKLWQSEMDTQKLRKTRHLKKHLKNDDETKKETSGQVKDLF